MKSKESNMNGRRYDKEFDGEVWHCLGSERLEIMKKIEELSPAEKPSDDYLLLVEALDKVESNLH